MTIKNQGTHRLLIILTLLSLVLSPGCGTLFQKKLQRIPVTSNPVGATVSVNGTLRGVTPLELKLPREEKEYVIRIESPGYNPIEIRPKRKMSTRSVLGNFLLGAAFAVPITFYWMLYYDEGQTFGKVVGVELLSAAGIGALLVGFDFSFKAGYELTPRELNITLTKADGTPRVETILLDADELRNVKWIRISRD